MTASRKKRSTKGSPFPGIWQITRSEDLDEEHLHLVGQAAIEFKKDHLGDLRFGALDAQLDWRAKGSLIEFTFQGFEEGDEVCGRGKANIGDDGVVRGRLLYFLGDEFTFEAERMSDHRKRIECNDKVGVRLAQRERKLIVDESHADEDLLKQLRLVRVDGESPPVKFTLDDWEDLQGHVAAASNHHENKNVSKELLAIFGKIQKEVFDKYDDQE